MHRTLSLKIGQVNSYLVCPLCKGYLIDSYTINECLHSFCKSCIIKYIKRKECCPVCKINIIKDRMNLFLKPDVNLQCIVYKIVPELFKKEMKRRRQFYLTHPKALKFLKKKKIFDKEAVGELDDDIFVIDKYTDISLSIEYSDTGLADVCESARYKELDPPSSKIYLQCPATLSIQLLKKFISIKFDLSTTKNLDVMYDDKPLSKDITLLDVSYIYAWRRTAPMRLFYRINDQKMTNDLDKISQSGLNVLTPIDNNSERKVDEIFALSNLPKNAPIKNENDNGVENFPPKVQLNENQMTDSQFDSSVKPEAKSTPQKDQYLDSSQESNLQIDLSANESIIKENLENSTKSFSNIKNPVSSNQTSSSHNLNTDESLTITNMVESIKSAPNLGTRLETASNSDKENKEEFQIKNEVPCESDCESSKLKKTKITKLKKEANSNDEASEHTKKKKSSKSTDQNPTKKQKLSQAFQKKNSEQLNKEVSDCELDNSFSKKLNTHIGSNSNFSSNTSSSPSQLAMLQNFQLMPLMYPWKSLEYSPNFSNFQQAQQIQNQQQANNSINSQVLLNQKYASHVFDFLQNKAQPYQNFYATQNQNSHHHHHQQQQQQQQQQQLHSQFPCIGQSGINHFNQYNYMEEFKKPLANFASLIQEATSYQNNVFTAKVLQNENTSMDSLKETQMKISESCSLVND